MRRTAEEHPLRQEFWALLMLALYRSGRPAEALRAYAELRRHLGDEVGIEPSRDLIDLEQRMLLQDSSLDLPRHRPAPVGRTPRRFLRIALVLASAVIVAVVTLAVLDRPHR